MSKFNLTGLRRITARSPIRSEVPASGVTFEGAPGYARDAKGELFLLAVTNMVGEDTFYEGASDRDARFAALVRELAVSDPDWTARLIGWLRTGANLRSASLVAAAEFVAARLAAGDRRRQPGGHRVGAAARGRAGRAARLLARHPRSGGAEAGQARRRGRGGAALLGAVAAEVGLAAAVGAVR